MGEQDTACQANTQDDGVGIGLIGVSVVVPLGKGHAQLIGDVRIFGSLNVPHALTQALCREPVAANGDLGIDSQLLHLARQRVGDDVKRAVLIISIDRSDVRGVILLGGDGDQIVVAEAAGHQLLHVRVLREIRVQPPSS